MGEEAINNQGSAAPVGQAAPATDSNSTAGTTPAATQGQPTSTAQGATQEIDYKAEYEKIKTSYDNLRPAYTQATQKLSELQKQAIKGGNPAANQPAPQVQTQTQAQTTAAQNPAEHFKNVLTEALGAAVNPLREELMEQRRETEITQYMSRVIAKNPKEFEQVAPELERVLASNPEFWSLGTERAIDIAYKLARTNVIESALQSATQTAVDSAVGNKEFKANISETQRAAATNQSQVTAEKQIVNNILSAGKRGGSIF